MPRFLLVLLLTMAPSAAAHPGIGIVRDSKGHVFYTDLVHVWRLAPDGSTTIAVRNVHTHELAIAGDTVFGEHLWYESGADRWWHRLWRLTPSGVVEDIVAKRAGFRDDYDDLHFVRDGMGAMYWADGGPQVAIRMRPGGGPVRTLAETPFARVGWLTASHDGVVFFVAEGDLHRVDGNGRRTMLARDVGERGAVPLHVRAVGWLASLVRRNAGADHDVAGVWTDRVGNVYLAVPGGRVVKRVMPGGRVEVVARSDEGWAVTGGLVAPDGALLLLEYGGQGRARVRRL